VRGAARPPGTGFAGTFHVRTQTAAEWGSTMALRISVDLDGLRWADLFRFVDLARNGGISADDQVDVITYGSDPLSVSLSARIYPPAEGFLSSLEHELPAGEQASRGNVPAVAPPPPASPAGGSFGYDAPPERASQNGAHYPAFEPGDRPGAQNLPSFNGYDAGEQRPPAPSPNGGSHYPAFDPQTERINPGNGGGQFAGFEPVFDRNGNAKEPAPGPAAGADSPYLEEFARLQEGLMRQVRRPDEVRPERG